MQVFPITFNWLQDTEHTGCSPGFMHYCTWSCWITVVLRKLEKVVVYFTTILLVSVSTRGWNLSKVHLNIDSRCWQRDESVCHRQQVTEKVMRPPGTSHRWLTVPSTELYSAVPQPYFLAGIWVSNSQPFSSSVFLITFVLRSVIQNSSFSCMGTLDDEGREGKQMQKKLRCKAFT